MERGARPAGGGSGAIKAVCTLDRARATRKLFRDLTRRSAISPPRQALRPRTGENARLAGGGHRRGVIRPDPTGWRTPPQAERMSGMVAARVLDVRRAPTRPHSFADPLRRRRRSIDLAFARGPSRDRVLEGEVVLTLREPGAGPLDLDTRDLRLRGRRALDGAYAAARCSRRSRFLRASGLRVQHGRREAAASASCTRTSPAAIRSFCKERSGPDGGEIRRSCIRSQRQTIHVALAVAPLQVRRGDWITVGSAPGSRELGAAWRLIGPTSFRGPRARRRGDRSRRRLRDAQQRLTHDIFAFAVGDYKCPQGSSRARLG